MATQQPPSGYTLRLASTDGGPEVFFAINPTSSARSLLVQVGKAPIGQNGATLDSENASALIDWLQAHRADIPQEP